MVFQCSLKYLTFLYKSSAIYKLIEYCKHHTETTAGKTSTATRAVQASVYGVKAKIWSLSSAQS